MTEDKQTQSRIRRVKEFFKPSILELLLMGFEVPFVSPMIGILSTEPSQQGIGEQFAYFLTPQALTYVGARAYEILGKRNHLVCEAIQVKVPFRR